MMGLANSGQLYVFLFRIEDGHVLRRELDFNVEGQQDMDVVSGEKLHDGCFKKGRCTLLIKLDC